MKFMYMDIDKIMVYLPLLIFKENSTCFILHSFNKINN